MKKKWPLILIIILIIALCGGAIFFFIESKKKKNEYKQGVISQNVYTSSWLGIKYTPIEGMEFLSDEDLRAYADSFSKSVGNAKVNAEFEALNSQQEQLNLLVISPENNKDTEESILQQIVQGIGNSGKIEYSKYKLGDIEFNRASNVKSDQWEVTFLVKKIDDKVAFLTVRAASDDHIDKMLSGFSKL